jgi:MFS transporter, ACS family, glucarate transporter
MTLPAEVITLLTDRCSRAPEQLAWDIWAEINSSEWLLMTPMHATTPSAVRPTGSRHWVVAFAASISIITYIDRVCISQAKGAITDELGLTNVQMGYVFAAFAWAYAIFEIPGGWLGDRIGPRKVLMRVIAMWSFFTAATGWAWNLGSLLLTRFLFGAGEAGCFPNLAKAFTNWLPAHERSRAVGVMWFSARWGGAFTPLLVVWVIALMGWRHAFELFGGIGVVWAFCFYWWFRDNPRDHKSVNEAELALIDEDRESSAGHFNVPWSKLLSSSTVWLLLGQYFCFGYGWYFYITWLPTYLREGRNLPAETAAFLAGFPLFFGGIGSMLSGLLAARLARVVGDIGKSRRGIAYFGFAAAAILLVLAAYIRNPYTAMLAMGMSSFFLDLIITCSWSTCMDVGGKYAGTLTGSMNMTGQIAGGVAPVVVGYILNYMDGNWRVTFWVSAIIYAIGALCWAWIDPVTLFNKTEQEQDPAGLPLEPSAS